MGKQSRAKSERRKQREDSGTWTGQTPATAEGPGIPASARTPKRSLFKYVGPGSIDKVFTSQEFVTLKCGYPSEFNDPYELFLTMDFTEKPEMIAFYRDVVGDLPQLPTTCFSKSPAVLPMWAHYASNLQGFAIEFDENILSEGFPESNFGDVDYDDEPSTAVQDNLYRAYEIGKFRYMHFLRMSVFSAAYFTKQSCWAYEIERRMIVGDGEVKKIGAFTLLDVPVASVKSIICGPRASDEVAARLRLEAEKAGCQFLKMHIGRSTGIPYFDSPTGGKFVFSNDALASAAAHCSVCGEPVKVGLTHCSWCLISDSHRIDAASRNSLRMLDRYGMLDAYMEQVQAIGRKRHSQSE